MVSSIEDGVLSKSLLRSNFFFFEILSLRFLHALLSGQEFDVGLPPYLQLQFLYPLRPGDVPYDTKFSGVWNSAILRIFEFSAKISTRET